MDADEALYNELLDSAVSNGVFIETPDDHLQWSDEFSKIRDEELKSLKDDAEFARTHEQYLGTSPKQNPMVTAEILASANAIRQMIPTIDEDDALLLAETFARFDREEAIDGVPEGFIPISGEEIERYLQRNPTSILYFWREDCPPCQTMKETLEALLADGTVPNNVGTAAIYGPNYVPILRERYQVNLAPTILFTKDKTVETRHIGETYRDVLIKEIDSVIR